MSNFTEMNFIFVSGNTFCYMVAFHGISNNYSKGINTLNLKKKLEILKLNLDNYIITEWATWLPGNDDDK
jgi:hypothetical protein